MINNFFYYFLFSFQVKESIFFLPSYQVLRLRRCCGRKHRRYDRLRLLRLPSRMCYGLIPGKRLDLNPENREKFRYDNGVKLKNIPFYRRNFIYDGYAFLYTAEKLLNATVNQKNER